MSGTSGTQSQSARERQPAILTLPVVDESPCPYLPDRMSRSEAFAVRTLSGGVYEALMEQGFRRSGRVIYRPTCRACTACIPLRVDVARFAPTKSMRRVWRTNNDLHVEAGPPAASALKHDLFVRYLDSRHDDGMSRSPDAFVDFLYDSPMETQEFCYWSHERLIGVSLADVCPQGLSTVFMYFDPAEGRRSLGTYSILWELQWCRDQGPPYYYLGYWVENSRTMGYKKRFRPHECLRRSGRWEPEPASSCSA